ncbi:MAG: hypothetical protein ACTSSA_12070 [Candidatus Freyarchaeota archaeon]
MDRTRIYGWWELRFGHWEFCSMEFDPIFSLWALFVGKRREGWLTEEEAESLFREKIQKEVA